MQRTNDDPMICLLQFPIRGHWSFDNLCTGSDKYFMHDCKVERKSPVRRRERPKSTLLIDEQLA